MPRCIGPMETGKRNRKKDKKKIPLAPYSHSRQQSAISYQGRHLWLRIQIAGVAPQWLYSYSPASNSETNQANLAYLLASHGH